jgi:hypothetical protein
MQVGSEKVQLQLLLAKSYQMLEAVIHRPFEKEKSASEYDWMAETEIH